eukprot:CAMPEP_0184712330 /NCGR_PEP_ID=MMETSP0314-20130426/2879_1 /TAXON_ID=38298 /ORGANISM="Rhodella maculata, Strain CCMP 736" /LENGTH=793 /DNA_ID=CAMNT_0027174737 /DNA_START=1 /DNA_END=2382 /DNA_ORIENTATION=-
MEMAADAAAPRRPRPLTVTAHAPKGDISGGYRFYTGKRASGPPKNATNPYAPRRDRSAPTDGGRTTAPQRGKQGTPLKVGRYDDITNNINYAAGEPAEDAVRDTRRAVPAAGAPGDRLGAPRRGVDAREDGGAAGGAPPVLDPAAAVDDDDEDDAEDVENRARDKKEERRRAGEGRRRSGPPRRSIQEIAAFYAERGIDVEGRGVPPPVQEFGELPACVGESVIRVMRDIGFERPTPVQSMVWAAALSGRDTVGIAETGSGKTMAFVLPLLVHVWGNKRLEEIRREKEERAGGAATAAAEARLMTDSDPDEEPRDDDFVVNQLDATKFVAEPRAIIVVPTRELAVQIEEECNRLAGAGIHTLSLFGGASKAQLEHQLRRGVDVALVTPGRLVEALEAGDVSLHKVSFVVLDEADRMMELGFEPQLRAMMGQLRPDRQTVMTTATWPREVVSLSKDFLPRAALDAVVVRCGFMTDTTVNKNIKQIVTVCDLKDRLRLLHGLLAEIEQEERILVFVSSKHLADQLCFGLRRRGYSALAVHGHKPQDERLWVLNQFRSGRARIVFCTDVVARGLDFKDVNIVVNFDYPKNGLEDYVHRIGRTGRAGAKGTAYTFFPRELYKTAPELIQQLREADQDVPAELLALVPFGPSEQVKKSAKFNPASGYGGRITLGTNSVRLLRNVMRSRDEEADTNRGDGGAGNLWELPMDEDMLDPWADGRGKITGEWLQEEDEDGEGLLPEDGEEFEDMDSVLLGDLAELGEEDESDEELDLDDDVTIEPPEMGEPDDRRVRQESVW